VIEAHLCFGEDRDSLNHELLKMDWITSDLHSEIISPLLYPSSDEKDPATGTRQDQDAFVLLVKAQILFPKCRIFASFKQLDWLAKLCLEA
jgi:hypothetical protein